MQTTLPNLSFSGKFLEDTLSLKSSASIGDITLDIFFITKVEILFTVVFLFLNLDYF